jgi:hypothetical protein
VRKLGGTIAIRFLFIGVKGALVVNKNIAASATRALTTHD